MKLPRADRDEVGADFDAWLRGVQADAWDEGESAGVRYGFSSGLDEKPVNPYREKQ